MPAEQSVAQAIRAERQPNFIAAHDEETKVQFSQVHEFVKDLPLFGAYTLQGLWMQGAPSSPFKEIAHHPEIYWQTPRGELGLEHESNGVDNRSVDFEGESRRSRSLQRVYWNQPKLYRWLGIDCGLKLQAPLFVKARSDYHDYMGYFDLSLARQFPLALTTMKYRRGPRGGRFQADLSINILNLFDSQLAARSRTWLYLEYYHGYAETLIHYDRFTVATRLGLRLFL